MWTSVLGWGLPGTMLADISTGAETTMDVDVGSGIRVPGTMLADMRHPPPRPKMAIDAESSHSA